MLDARSSHLNFRDKDKDPKETEPYTLIPFKLQASHNINAIVSYGDNAQLSPLITGLHAKECFNKFGQQLRLSFDNRLSRRKHPSQVLNEQFRFRPVSVEWLNQRTYGGKMQYHTSTNSIVVNPATDLSSEIEPLFDPCRMAGGFLLRWWLHPGRSHHLSSI
jgi:hypothetical protein